MAEGTRFAKLESMTVELQKNQLLLDGKLNSMDNRMSNLEETLNS